MHALVSTILICTLLRHLPPSATETVLEITSPIVTNKGTWSSTVELCGESKFVVAVDVASHSFVSPTRDDELGLVAIALQCSEIPARLPPSSADVIFTSVEGVDVSAVDILVANQVLTGTKHHVRPAPVTMYTDKAQIPRPRLEANISVNFQLPLRTNCGGEYGVAVGFQLNSEQEEGSRDNTGANNIRLICSRGPTYGEAFGGYKGKWTQPQLCGKRYALCGVQTQSVPLNVPPIDGDHIGVENLRFNCCPLPNPAASCNPAAGWELIEKTERIAEPRVCNYTTAPRIGLEVTPTLSTEEQAEHEHNIDVGFDLVKSETLQAALYTNIVNANPQPDTADYIMDWAAAARRNWQSASSVHVPMPAPFDCSGTQPGPTGYQTVVEIYQLVVTCGTFSARTGVFKRVVTHEPYNGGAPTEIHSYFGN